MWSQGCIATGGSLGLRDRSTSPPFLSLPLPRECATDGPHSLGSQERRVRVASAARGTACRAWLRGAGTSQLAASRDVRCKQEAPIFSIKSSSQEIGRNFARMQRTPRRIGLARFKRLERRRCSSRGGRSLAVRSGDSGDALHHLSWQRLRRGAVDYFDICMCRSM